MKVRDTKIADLRIITPDVHSDERGFFMEAFNADTLRTEGIDFSIKQHNQSQSAKGVVRGIHFQWDPKLSKILRVVRGRAFVVAVDLRKKSSTLGKYDGLELSAENKELLYAPFGFGTAFCALEDNTDVEYYYSAIYNPKGESSIRFDDPDIGIAWPKMNWSLSPRDANAESLKEWLARPESDLF